MSAIILVISALLLGLYGLYRWFLPKPLPGIPYNAEAAHKLLGDVPNLISEASRTGDVAAWFRKQAEKHQAPVVQLFVTPFGPPMLLVCDFREAQDVLLHRGKEFDRSQFVRSLFYGIGKDHHITMQTGPEWKGHRRLLQDLMSPGFLTNVAAPSIYASCLNTLRLWDLKADLAGGRPFSASHDVSYAALDAVLSFALGDGFEEKATQAQIELLETVSAGDLGKGGADDPVEFPAAPLGDAIEAMLVLTGSVGRVRAALNIRLKWWSIMREKKVAAAWKKKEECLHGELDKAIQARIRHQEGGDDWVRSAVDHMVDRESRLAEKEGRRPAYHSAAMVAEVFGFLVAGHDTTSNTLRWGIKLLADHPAAQARLRGSLHAAFAGAAGAEGGRLPTADEIARAHVPYLDAAVEEMLRVGSTVAMVDRDCVRDTTLLGHRVPRGTTLIFLTSGPGVLTPAVAFDGSRRSPRAREAKVREWPADDIGLFRPERWLVRQQDGEEVFDSQAGPTMPFSLGLRGCFGKRLAYLELRLLVAMIVWTFELLECPKELSGYQATDGVVHEPNDCYVRLRKLA